jgi:hypothetical protein
MSEDYRISISIQAVPLALVFEGSDGVIKTAPLDVEDALGLAVQLLANRSVLETIRLPDILRRLLIRALYRSWEACRQKPI